MKLVSHVFSCGLLVKADTGALPDTVLYQLARAYEKHGRMVSYVSTQYGNFMGMVTPLPDMGEKFRYCEHAAFPSGLMEVYNVPEKIVEVNGKCRKKKKS